MSIRILILLLSAVAAALGAAIISLWGRSWAVWLLVLLFCIVIAIILALFIGDAIHRADRIELIKKDRPDPNEPPEGYNNDPRFGDPGTH